MKLSLYNTLTHSRELFEPLNPNLVKMYVCGPTVYDHPHIGNARSVVVYDILYRILIQIFGSNHVRYVRNITDVDDKIIDRAKELNIKISDLTTTTTKYFHQDMDYLSCLCPTIEPKATEHIAEMIKIIQQLIELGHAYISNGHVYFDVLSSKNYTSLSGRTFEKIQYSAQSEENIDKKHLSDFVLWKSKSEAEEVNANFESPFGIGRPGWHIECSAMSHKYLGENFDIHGGGADLIFPHHTNEIAQSTCAFPASGFARTWVHNGFLTVGGEKMSKSLGNFLTVKDLRDKNIPGDVSRLLLLSAHYRKPLDFNNKALSDAHKTIDYWYRAIEKVDFTDNETIKLPNDFLSALYEDLNTPLVIKIINDYAKVVHATHTIQGKAPYALKILACANFIGLMHKTANEWFHSDVNDYEVKNLIDERNQAKKDKNWELADKIRNDLNSKGIILEDKLDGATIWRKK